MDYMTTKEAADIWGISDRRVLQYCNAGRIGGAVKMGNTWLIPQKCQKACRRKIKKRKNKENSPKENTCNE